MNYRTSILMVTIAILLSVIVGSVGATTYSWNEVKTEGVIPQVLEPGLIEKVIEIFNPEQKQIIAPTVTQYELTLTKQTVSVDKNTRLPSIVIETKTKSPVQKTNERTSVYVNQTDLKKTGRATGFIKGVVYK